MAVWKKTKGGSETSPSSGFNKKRKFDNNNSKDSEQSANSKKRALKHARQSHRPYFESVLAAKELWNKLRVKTNTPEDNKSIMVELMNLLTGKFQRVAMQHDASRVVQAAIQFGDKDQRGVIVKELCESGNMIQLAQVQYAHFVILKLIKYCYRDAEKAKLIVKVRTHYDFGLFSRRAKLLITFSATLNFVTGLERTFLKTCGSRSRCKSRRTSLLYVSTQTNNSAEIRTLRSSLYALQ